MSYYFQDVLKNKNYLKKFNENFNELAPICFLYDEVEEKSENIANHLKKAYLPFDEIDDRGFGGLNMVWLISFLIKK